MNLRSIARFFVVVTISFSAQMAFASPYDDKPVKVSSPGPISGTIQEIFNKSIAEPQMSPGVEEAIKLALNPDNYDQRDAILTRAAGQARSVYDILALAKHFKSSKRRDEFIFLGIPFAKNKDEILTLSRSVKSRDIADRVLLQGTKVAVSPGDFASLAGDCYDPKVALSIRQLGYWKYDVDLEAANGRMKAAEKSYLTAKNNKEPAAKVKELRADFKAKEKAFIRLNRDHPFDTWAKGFFYRLFNVGRDGH